MKHTASITMRFLDTQVLYKYMRTQKVLFVQLIIYTVPLQILHLRYYLEHRTLILDQFWFLQ